GPVGVRRREERPDRSHPQLGPRAGTVRHHRQRGRAGFIPVERHADVPAGTVDAYLASVPVGRMGTPEDVAHAVSFLASDGAGSSPASVSWSTEAAPSATDGGTRS